MGKSCLSARTPWFPIWGENTALHNCETITSPFGPPQGHIIGNDVKPLIIIGNGEIPLAFSAVSRMLSARVFKLTPPQIWGEVLLIFFH